MLLASSKGPQFEDPRVAETAGPQRNFSVDRVTESERSPTGPLSFEPEPSKDAIQRPPHVQRRPPHAGGRPHPTKQQQGPCHACHREGHAAKNCPAWKGRCYRCQKEGHTSESCTLPDKRRKVTRIIANDNRELARALANITQQLQEIKVQLRPNWAWRTLRSFRERTATHIQPRKPPEETEPKNTFQPAFTYQPKPPEASPKPPEAQKQRTDLQGCNLPPHLYIGEKNMSVPRLPPASTKTWKNMTPEECRQSELDYQKSKNKDNDDWMILHTRDNTWLFETFPKNPHTDPFAGSVATIYAMHVLDNIWTPGWAPLPPLPYPRFAPLEPKPPHKQRLIDIFNRSNAPPWEPKQDHQNASPPSDDNYDTPSPTPSDLQREQEDYNNTDDWDDS